MSAITDLNRLRDRLKPSARMPVVFLGHGSPMNALERNRFTEAWRAFGAAVPRPRAILAVSAHWHVDGLAVTAMPRPRTIHDFYGFPEALYKVAYPAPGAPPLAATVQGLVRTAKVEADTAWGLDHGTWSVLLRMFPKADIPVVQLSLDRTRPPADHYALGRELAPLRRQGVLIVGSGNVVHNLRAMAWTDEPFDWAVAFDRKAKDLMEGRDHQALIHYDGLGKDAALAIPTNEHYLPLLYALALQEPGEALGFFAEQVTLGSISMRSVKIG